MAGDFQRSLPILGLFLKQDPLVLDSCIDYSSMEDKPHVRDIHRFYIPDKNSTIDLWRENCFIVFRGVYSRRKEEAFLLKVCKNLLSLHIIYYENKG